ncbi:putative peptidase a1 protein [Botrytis fragariae]|uniref:Putative peptidase a1 protein n=1 Tax=Botrytis fragariae TaxID=1964551 RepID=A0A8H6AZN2_9HELO|nr:putative peptidase a1 protein [Botrytis fragariae]KAF5876591.1 putative peptidase a1 protein [Botrytis fragariae]
MRTTFASALLVSAIAFPSLSCAQKFVQFPIARVNNGDAFVAAINVAVGNSPQNMTAILDTGSSDFWVPASGSKLYANPKNQCIASDKKFSTGSFASNSSTTFVTGKPNFFAIYTGGVNVTGTSMQDSIRLGNAELKNNTMGLSTQGFLPSVLFPVMVIGFAAQEFSATEQNPTPYENLPLTLKSVDLTNTAAYGIYFNYFSGNSSVATRAEIYSGSWNNLRRPMRTVPLV